MIGVTYDKFTYISGFTLSLLEDSGWYKVDWDYMQPYGFGKDKGCPFFEDDCIDKTTKKSNFPDFWCDERDRESCTWDLKQLGTCLIRDATSYIPSKFNYFSDQTGGSPYGQYCPFVDPTRNQSLVLLLTSVFCVCFCGGNRTGVSNPARHANRVLNHCAVNHTIP